MPNFAVINGNIVENIIVCENKEIAEQVTLKECIEYKNEDLVYQGCTWDGNKFNLPDIQQQN